MKNHALAFDATPGVCEAVTSENNLSLEELVAQIQSSESYAEVSLREDVAEAIFEAMQQQDVTRAELARRLGKSRAYVTKILSGQENLSIESLGKIFRALECQFRIEYSVSNPSPDSMKAAWTPLLEAKTSCSRFLSNGAPLNWKPMSSNRLAALTTELISDPNGRWEQEALGLH